MPDLPSIQILLKQTETYFANQLLPFWIERSVDKECGGFLTYFDKHGKPTGETKKTFLMQIRMLFSMSHAHRAGFGNGKCAVLAKIAADFILEHYWDEKNEGWIWIADRKGTVTFSGKIGYGQCFGMYAFSEYYLATGDLRGKEAALRSYDVVCRHMLDSRNGGYLEIMKPDWQPEESGKKGGDRKSFDVHMHMMEALTTLYEMTGHLSHRRRLLEVIDILINKMLHPIHGTGYMQFAMDFTPLPGIRFAVEWGSDQEPDSGSMPLDTTSYGHNVEFIWLLLHAADILGQPRSTYAEVVRKICDHCLQFGLDNKFGGVFIDGLADAPPTDSKKQFWQQAEVLVGFLDAYQLLGDEKYLLGFKNVYQFVMTKFVNHTAGGEWYAMLDREGKPIWDYLGHEWKISYHTVRSMVQTIRRLRILAH